jgi:oxygen-independent coproporphyrinogen-3 oxidase
MRREVIERLMCDLAVDLKAVARAHGREPEVFADALPKLDELAADGLALRRGWRVMVPAQSRGLVRAVCAAFDSYLQPDAARHSRAI